MSTHFAAYWALYESMALLAYKELAFFVTIGASTKSLQH